MANYRSIHVKFWTDGTIEGLSPIGKLLLLYFITNPYRNESGLYSITIKRMSDDIGLTSAQIGKTLTELEEKKRIFYDAKESVVWVVNAIKHQPLNDNCRKSVLTDIERCSSVKLTSMLLTYYKSLNYLWLPNPSEPVVMGSQPINRVQGQGTGIGTGKEGEKEEKKPYGEFRLVLLTDEQRTKLIKKLGNENRLLAAIQILDSYKESKGKTYKSDYATFSTWVISELEKREQNSSMKKLIKTPARLEECQYCHKKFPNASSHELSCNKAPPPASPEAVKRIMDEVNNLSEKMKIK